MSSTMTLDETKIPRLILVGDVHGNVSDENGHVKRYVDLVSGYAFSLQVGDLGFDYSALNKLDPETNKLVAGNHENYSELLAGKVPHFLGDYGMWKNKYFPYGGLFFVRGGFSLDKDDRILGRDWFPEEEITIPDGYKAMELYEKEKPNFVVSHECPSSLIRKVGSSLFWNVPPSRTAQLLEGMLHIHKPKIWVFGHHHKSLDVTINYTRFIGLSIFEPKTFPLKGIVE